MEQILQGKAVVLGKNIDTDQIYPGRFLALVDPKDIGEHCLDGFDPELRKLLRGGIVVAGTNFGCGSSREHAPIALINMGASAVLADSFARIFFRNAINIGLAILECPEASDRIENGDEVSIDFDTGMITNLTQNEQYQAEPFPEFVKKIINADGLLNSIQNR